MQDWNFVKRQLACYGEKSILNRMMNRKAQEISSQSAQDASELLNHIDMARAHAVSSAIASVLAWVCHILLISVKKIEVF